jgi:hypothetical protein
MKRIIKKHYLNAFILVSAVLSFAGYKIYYNYVGEQATLADIIYSVFQLFLFNSDFKNEQLNIYLNIARFAAPASLATAVISKILSVFSKTLKKGQARRFKNHIIFCGDNLNLAPLAREQAQQKNRCIYISPEENKTNPSPYILPLAYWEFTQDIMDDIAFYNCRYIIISNQNDLRSIEYATSLVHSMDEKLLKKRIEIVIVFNNPEWSEISNDLGLLEKLNQHVNENHFLNIRYIDYLNRGIRKLLLEWPPDRFKPVFTPQSDSPVLLITGFNEISKRLILGLAMNCHYISHNKIKVLLHVKKSNEIEAFIKKYQLEKTIDLICMGEEALEDLKQKIDVTYLCDADTVDLYGNIALLNRYSLLKTSHTIICTHEVIAKSHLMQIVDHVFVVSDETDTLCALVDESLDEMAMTIHMNYIQARKDNKQLSETIDTHKEWDKLTDEAKDRNRYPADHIYTKIRAMNCELCDASNTRAAFDISSYKYLEEMSEAEHNRWCAYMYCKGWRHGVNRDDILKIHPDLIPYIQLNDSAKKKDRENILQIPELLGLKGLKLVEKSN